MMTLCRLPPEIRLMVYHHLFHSLDVKCGFHIASLEDCRDLLRGKKFDLGTQNTAILRTCRLVYQEACPMLAAYVQLCFPNHLMMMHYLSAMSEQEIKQLRYVHVILEHAYLCFPQNGRTSPFKNTSTCEVLRLFPTLRLHRLIVDGSETTGNGLYTDLFDLQCFPVSCGWKEAHFLTRLARKSKGYGTEPLPMIELQRLRECVTEAKPPPGSTVSATFYVAKTSRSSKEPGAVDWHGFEEVAEELKLPSPVPGPYLMSRGEVCYTEKVRVLFWISNPECAKRDARWGRRRMGKLFLDKDWHQTLLDLDYIQVGKDWADATGNRNLFMNHRSDGVLMET